MLSYIKGIVEEVQNGSLIVECHGIGYRIFVPGTIAARLPVNGEEVKIYTHLHVREDAMQLYGFLTKAELAMFQMLIGVNGIGPKGALGVLTVLTVEELRFAILGSDAKTIAKAPGIGKKTAEKVVLELRDKLDWKDIYEEKSGAELTKQENVTQGIRQEVVEALITLGYSQTEAFKVMTTISISEEMSTETVLKMALKQMAMM